MHKKQRGRFMSPWVHIQKNVLREGVMYCKIGSLYYRLPLKLDRHTGSTTAREM